MSASPISASPMSGGILITGGSGQLGAELARLAAARRLGATVVSRPDFDFDRPDTIAAALRAASPSLVINPAAYTAVDQAESDEAAALRANRDGPALLAALCRAAGIPLIHVSTDYVFDGSKGAPYLETDTPNPACAYGRTKLAGEQQILASGADAIILRTAWVYAASGKNFLRTMLGAARAGRALRVVADQKGTPTAAPDLARAILDIAGQIAAGGFAPHWRGVYHATNSGETTWFGFAQAIFAAAAPLGLKPPALTPIATADWPTPARRPADSRLDTAKLATTFGLRLPDWREALSPIVREALGAMAIV
jgi:dTDP-4-dehydrorhamnose reductase